MIQAIFFDFNGVIIDDEPLQFQAYLEVLKEHGIALTEAQYYGALGLNDVFFVSKIFEAANLTLNTEITDNVIEAKSNIHRNMIEDELPLFPGVVTFIKAAARRYSVCLVSMARRVEIDYVLRRARLEHLFSAIISAEDVNLCKPAPDCYAAGLRKLNERRRSERLLPVLPKECLVIEDSPPGIVSGKSAGMKTLGVTNTVSESELRAAGADVVTRSLSDWTMDSVYHLFSE